MVYSLHSGNLRSHAMFFGALLTIALAFVPLVESAAAQAKAEAHRATPLASRTRASNAAKSSIKPHPDANVNRDLIVRLEAYQKEIEKRIEASSEATGRGVHELNYRLDSLTDQLHRLASSEERNVEISQDLAVALHPTKLLLKILISLQIVFCVGLFFVGFQLKKFSAAALPKALQQKDTEINELSDRPFEPQWKA
jgi:hypothetical protein